MNKDNVFVEFLYEYKRARRSILFKVFVILATLGLVVYQFSFLSREGDAVSMENLLRFYMDWTSRALASSIAYKSAYYFNIIQLLFIVCFVANDSRAFTLSTRGALCVRPQGNYEIVVGSFLGRLLTVMVLNGLTFVTSIVFNLVLYPGSFDLLSYFFYWGTLTLPASVYFLGISSLVVRFVRNAGASILVLFLVLGGIIFLGAGLLYGLLDPCARYIPNMFSDFTGHVNLGNCLMQRVCIFFAGAGCLMLSIIPYPRIPNSVLLSRNCLVVACIFLLSAGSLGYIYCNRHTSVCGLREIYKQVYDEYSKYSGVRVVRHDLHVKELADGGISVISHMTVINKKNKDNPLIIYLNPDLKVTSIEIDGENISFRRDHQVVVPDKVLRTGETCDVSIVYEGGIDNEVCFLDVAPGIHDSPEVNALGMYHFGNTPAFCGKRYKLLTPECVWYPVCVPPYGTSGERDVNFTRYSLKVEHTPRLKAISQGDVIENGEGETSFSFKHNMPGISLCVGNYKKREIQVDSTRVELFYLPDHEYLLKPYHFTEEKFVKDLRYVKSVWEKRECLDVARPFTDEEWSLVKEMMDDMPEVASGDIIQLVNDRRPFDPTSQYPYRRLTLLEVPCDFYCFPGLMHLTGEREQGGMVFIPEKLYSMKKYRQEIPQDDEDVRLILERDIFNPLLKEGSCSIMPVLRGRTTFIFSEKYPMIHDIFTNMVHRSLEGGFLEVEDYRAVKYLERNSLKDALYDNLLSRDELQGIIRKKSVELYARIMMQVRAEPFQQFYIDYITSNIFKEITLEECFQKFYQTFGVRLDSLVENWYNADRLSILDIRDARAIKIGESRILNLPDVLYSFKVFNRSDVPGIVMTTDCQGWVIPPREGRMIRAYNLKDVTRFSNRFSLDMPISQNLPSSIYLPLEKIETARGVDTVAGVFSLDSCMFFQGEKMDEIIVDNEDPGFGQIKMKKFDITSLFRKEVTSCKKYNNKRYSIRDTWEAVIDGDFYGFPVQSALFKRAGSGKQKVVWRARLSQEGKYEVFFFHVQPYSKTDDPKREFYYTVFDGKEEHEVTAFVEGNEAEGWISLGVFDFLEEAKVILSDRDRKNDDGKYKYPQELVADAVKWVKINE